ncbi:aKG-HExxH-type peptide beta-hydroxylase [Amycolatopsis granulosa]|uniref:aKG-HExxH-type peptide beta-hydroxylase n=1 Tax=Amycolatopsis granulosa TaxID=185684 RepID=UPI0014247165|nr:HEXXH motif-containing putative peptide modification protein [Amycolatopsis granulosa]NIH88287.1 HEXXH motif-containing protein [Amycolatopsis granulosa]
MHKRVPRFRIHAATPEQAGTLARSARLAVRVAPALATSALSHNFMVVLGSFEADHRFTSFTVPGLPGVLVLSPDVLSGEQAVAEALCQEACHLKFLDLDYVHPLFRSGFPPERSPRITPVWHEDDPRGGDWPVDRVLAAMHGYLALAVFLGRAAAEVPDWENAAARAAQCRTRAGWLREAVQQHPGHLTEPGRRFVAWIGGMLAELGTAR